MPNCRDFLSKSLVSLSAELLLPHADIISKKSPEDSRPDFIDKDMASIIGIGAECKGIINNIRNKRLTNVQLAIIEPTKHEKERQNQVKDMADILGINFRRGRYDTPKKWNKIIAWDSAFKEKYRRYISSIINKPKIAIVIVGLEDSYAGIDLTMYALSIAREQGAVICILIDRRYDKSDNCYEGSPSDITAEIFYDDTEPYILDNIFKEIDLVITSVTTDIISLARAKDLSAVTAGNMKDIIMKSKADLPLVKAVIRKEEIIRL